MWQYDAIRQVGPGIEQEIVMRTSMIGRWVGRAAVFVAAVAFGFLAIGATAASAGGIQNPDIAVQLGTEWN